MQKSIDESCKIFEAKSSSSTVTVVSPNLLKQINLLKSNVKEILFCSPAHISFNIVL